MKNLILKLFVGYLIIILLLNCKKSFEPIAINPNEDKIAYISTEYIGNNNVARHLNTINYDGTQKTKLFELDLWYMSHCFSSDGSKIFFDFNKDIYYIKVNGFALTQLTNNDRINEYPQYLPNSSQIIFTSSKSITLNQGTLEIYSIEINGENEKSLSGKIASDIHPIPSPDGYKISFISKRTGQWELWTMDSNGENQIKLTDSPEQEWDQQYSPDGSKIVFEFSGEGFREIFIIDSDGSNLMQLSENLGYVSNPKFSPDGTSIIFHAAKDGEIRLYMMEIQNKNLIYLENNIPGNWRWDEYPQFTADGKRIVFQSRIENSSEICIMDVDGSNQKNLTNDEFDNVNPKVYP